MPVGAEVFAFDGEWSSIFSWVGPAVDTFKGTFESLRVCMQPPKSRQLVESNLDIVYSLQVLVLVVSRPTGSW